MATLCHNLMTLATVIDELSLKNTNAHSAILFVVVPRLIGNLFDPLALPISKNASTPPTPPALHGLPITFS